MSSSGSIILCYHRVASGDDDPFQLCVTPENFAAHLDEIVRHGEPSTLDEFALPSRRPRVVVTLDDGYADNLTNALPIAEAKGVPITVFVTSGAVDAEQPFWWDRLGTLLASRPPGVREINLPLAGGAVRIALGSAKPSEDLQFGSTATCCRCRWRRCTGYSMPSPRSGELPLRHRLRARHADVVRAGRVGGLRYGHDRGPHGRSRATSQPSGAGAGGEHLLLEGGTGAIDWSAGHAFRLPLWGTLTASTSIRWTLSVRAGSKRHVPPVRPTPDPLRIPFSCRAAWS